MKSTAVKHTPILRVLRFRVRVVFAPVDSDYLGEFKECPASVAIAAALGAAESITINFAALLLDDAGFRCRDKTESHNKQQQAMFLAVFNMRSAGSLEYEFAA